MSSRLAGDTWRGGLALGWRSAGDAPGLLDAGAPDGTPVTELAPPPLEKGGPRSSSVPSTSSSSSSFSSDPGFPPGVSPLCPLEVSPLPGVRGPEEGGGLSVRSSSGSASSRATLWLVDPEEPMTSDPGIGSSSSWEQPCPAGGEGRPGSVQGSDRPTQRGANRTETSFRERSTRLCALNSA